ncbi:uncharacterized protein [Engystomops pustulosus]|uniref:uncharacterized protein n=1 Tax=Engystomops pustulosus TaxID=76066 RepID=UPI003AFA4D45
MHCSQCYWETRQIGCQKKSCSFYHLLPRTIQGLYIPPTSELQEQSDITTPQHPPVIIPLLDEEDEEEEEEELDDIIMEERVKTQEEEEEEKAILAVCRSAGDIYKISICEENEMREDETPEGGVSKMATCDDDEKRKEVICGAVGDNTGEEKPKSGGQSQPAPAHEPGQGAQISAESNPTPGHGTEGESSQSPTTTHDPPAKAERTTYPKHHYRGDYHKDGQRWRRKYWYTDYDRYIPEDKGYHDVFYDDYPPWRTPYKKGWRKRYEEKCEEEHDGDHHKDGQRWRRKYWYTDYDRYYPEDKGYHDVFYDDYPPWSMPYKKGWRKRYEEKCEEDHDEDDRPSGLGLTTKPPYSVHHHQQVKHWRHGDDRPSGLGLTTKPQYSAQHHQQGDNWRHEPYQKRRFGEKKKEMMPQNDKDHKLIENDSYRKPYNEPYRKIKAVEKRTGCNQIVSNASSTEKNKDSTSGHKFQPTQKPPENTYRKPYNEPHRKFKTTEKRTGYNHSVGNASSTEKDKDSLSVPKTKPVQNPPENDCPYRNPYNVPGRKIKATEKRPGCNQSVGNASSTEKDKDSTPVPKTKSAQNPPEFCPSYRKPYKEPRQKMRFTEKRAGCYQTVSNTPSKEKNKDSTSIPKTQPARKPPGFNQSVGNGSSTEKDKDALSVPKTKPAQKPPD